MAEGAHVSPWRWGQLTSDSSARGQDGPWCPNVEESGPRLQQDITSVSEVSERWLLTTWGVCMHQAWSPLEEVQSSALWPGWVLLPAIWLLEMPQSPALGTCPSQGCTEASSRAFC